MRFEAGSGISGLSHLEFVTSKNAKSAFHLITPFFPPSHVYYMHDIFRIHVSLSFSCFRFANSAEGYYMGTRA